VEPGQTDVSHAPPPEGNGVLLEAIVIKEEPAYGENGSYDCSMCFESFRHCSGAVLKCSLCTAGPFHASCAKLHPKSAGQTKRFLQLSILLMMALPVINAIQSDLSTNRATIIISGLGGSCSRVIPSYLQTRALFVAHHNNALDAKMPNQFSVESLLHCCSIINRAASRDHSTYGQML